MVLDPSPCPRTAYPLVAVNVGNKHPQVRAFPTAGRDRCRSRCGIWCATAAPRRWRAWFSLDSRCRPAGGGGSPASDPARHDAAARVAPAGPAGRPDHALVRRRPALGGRSGAAGHGGHRPAAGRRGRQSAAPRGGPGGAGGRGDGDYRRSGGRRRFVPGRCDPAGNRHVRPGHCTPSPTCCRWWNIEELSSPPPPLGRSTVAALKPGLFWGAVGAIRQLLEVLPGGSAGPPDVFLTGDGTGPIVARLLAPPPATCLT